MLRRSSPEYTRRAHPFLWRHPSALLTGLALLFVIQASLVPFDFTLWGRAGERWLAERGASPSSLPNTIGSVFLYIPLGFLLHWMTAEKVRNAVGAWTISILLCAGLSFVLESLQALSPSRVSSLLDVTSNVMGAALGAGLASVTRFFVPPLISGAIDEIQSSPATAAVKGYMVILIICASVPFSFTLDRGLWREAVKNAIFTPFGRSYAERQRTEPSPAHVMLKADANDVTAAASQRVRADSSPFNVAAASASTLLEWAALRRWSRWCAECASFMLLAWLLQEALRTRFGFGARGCIALTMWMGFLLAFALSALQFMVVSRGFDATDILFRVCGLGIGAILWVRAQRKFSPPVHAGETFVRFGWVAAAVFIIYSGTIPWHFFGNVSDSLSRLTVSNFVPFMPYFETRPDRMFGDVAEKVAMYAVLGALLQLRARHAISGERGCISRVLRTPLLLCVSLSMLIEFVQFLMPARFPGLTDPVLAGVGCTLGLIAFEHVQGLYLFGCSTAAASPVEVGIRGMRPWSPEDMLLESIAVPHPDAPHEEVRSKPLQPDSRESR